MINTLNTEGYFVRINYWDGDVQDHKMPSEAQARKAAHDFSRDIKADVDVCLGASVLAVFRHGKEVGCTE